MICMNIVNKIEREIYTPRHSDRSLRSASGVCEVEESVTVRRSIQSLAGVSLRTFALLFCGLFLLAACDNAIHPIPEVDPDKPAGELITVNLAVSTMEYGEGGVVSRSASPNPNPVSLRGDTIPLEPDVIVRIVVFGGISYDSYYDYADFQMSGGLLTPYPAGSNPLSVAMGTFNFVAYSYNNDMPMPPYTPITAPVDSEDLLWGDSVATISAGSNEVHITMHHLMSKVVVRATTGLTSTDFMNSADINIFSYEPTLDVQTGVLDPNGSLMPKTFSWDITNERLPMQTSKPLYVYTNEADTTRLRIDQMRINYNTYPGPFDVTYYKPLEAGYSDTLLVQFNWARGGLGDRITWDSATGKYALTRDPTDAGLYFKFGSVVGVFSDVTPDGTTGTILKLPATIDPAYASFIASRDIAWYPNSISPAITNWATVPCFNTLSDYPSSKLITPEEGYHTESRVRAGKGDPCRLVGMDLDFIKTSSASQLTYAHIDNGIWRLPTVQENEWFTEGDHIGIYPTTPNDCSWDFAGGAYIYNLSPFGPGVGGAEFPVRGSGVVTEARKAKFLPGAGSRQAGSGYVDPMPTGRLGYYWSNQPDPREGGYALRVNHFHEVLFSYWWLADEGFSVRCVRQHLDFVITVDDWISGGNLGTGNVIL